MIVRMISMLDRFSTRIFADEADPDGYRIHDLLREDEFKGYAGLMHEHWEHKRHRSAGNDQ